MKLLYELDDDERTTLIVALLHAGDEVLAEKIEKHHRLAEFNEKIKNMSLKNLIDALTDRAWTDGSEGRMRWSSEITLLITRIYEKISSLEYAANDC
jgi:hypothetical protein